MDAKVSKKLGLKERYALMTRDLGWDTTYQPMDKVYPYDKYEGIKIHDWDKWEYPLPDDGRLLEYQAERERSSTRSSMPSRRTTATSTSPMRVISTRSSFLSPGCHRSNTWRTAASPTSAGRCAAAARVWRA